MTPEQLSRLQVLHDKLMERALTDADPANWVAGDIKPGEMTRDQRGDSKWCRGLAINTVTLTLQVQRLMSNPYLGGAQVPDKPKAAEQPEPLEPVTAEADPVEAEIQRYSAAAAKMIAKSAVNKARDGSKR